MVLQSNFIDDIATKGYCLIKNGGEDVLKEIITELGIVIQEKNIAIEADPKKWATSTKRMPLHSDHSKVDFVAWHCIEQTDNGGESLLSDISLSFNQLSQSQQNKIFNLQIKNVQLFKDDLPVHPFRIVRSNRTDFYFVPWLVGEDESEEVKTILNELNANIKANVITLLLDKDDILIINNKKMLHGRNEITGSTNRLLKRYWIKTNNL